MDNFYESLYDHAQETRALKFRTDPEYRAACNAVNRLLDIFLTPNADAQQEILDAVADLVYRANVIALAYGFRLGVRITAPDYL